MKSLEAARSGSERESAFWWMMDVRQQTGRSRVDLSRIKKAARSFPETRKLLWKYFHPGLVARTKAFWYRQIRYRSYRHRWRMTWRKIIKPFRKFRTECNLWRYRGKMRSGEYVGWLVDLSSEARTESRDQRFPGDWSLLEKQRGKKCAAAVKEGCIRVWERYEPSLPHERKPNEGVTYGTSAGLAGISVLWEEGNLDFSNLSFDDACRATRYALSDQNGLAHWFDDLIVAQPGAVISVLDACISAEWALPADIECYHLALSKLFYNESAACDLTRPMVLKRLTQGEPTNPEVLQYALFIVV